MRGSTRVESSSTLCVAWNRPNAPPLDRSNSSNRYWPAANVSVTNPRSMQKSSTGRVCSLRRITNSATTARMPTHPNVTSWSLRLPRPKPCHTDAKHTYTASRTRRAHTGMSSAEASTNAHPTARTNSVTERSGDGINEPRPVVPPGSASRSYRPRKKSLNTIATSIVSSNAKPKTTSTRSGLRKPRRLSMPPRSSSQISSRTAPKPSAKISPTVAVTVTRVGRSRGLTTAPLGDRTRRRTRRWGR